MYNLKVTRVQYASSPPPNRLNIIFDLEMVLIIYRGEFVNLFQEALNNPIDCLIVSKSEAHQPGQVKSMPSINIALVTIVYIIILYSKIQFF